MRRFFARLSFGSNSGDTPSISISNHTSNNGLEEQDFWNGHFNSPLVPLNNAACSSSTPTWNPDFASDPTAWEHQFINIWKQLKKILTCPNNNKMFNEVMLLQMYEDIVTRSQSQNHCLLVHKPILVPLLLLLQWCRKSAEERRFQLSNVDKYFVQLLNQICTKIAEDSSLLEFFFTPQFLVDQNSDNSLNEHKKDGSTDDEQQPFLVFSLLIPYMYSVEDIGQLARDALLLIMSVSHNLDFVAKHSNFCPVLAGGLSGCFSQLPRCICTALKITDHDEFHKINLFNDIEKISELAEFHKAILFCNAVVQVAHRTVVAQIIRYFYDGFLIEVFKSSVLESDSDDLVSKIVYYHMCLEVITEETLLMALLKILIVAETNIRNMNLLEIILSKLNNNEKLCRVVLSLIKTMIDLRCEDLMWNCLIRFILPFIPLKPHSRRFDVNVSLDAANCFLECIPECTRNIEEVKKYFSYFF